MAGTVALHLQLLHPTTTNALHSIIGQGKREKKQRESNLFPPFQPTCVVTARAKSPSAPLPYTRFCSLPGSALRLFISSSPCILVVSVAEMTKKSSMGDGSSVPKRRKQDVQKVVVSLKAEDRKKEQGPPTDSWSWRKYGQKPIKGSPHPRGYYKCSSYRGCPARKQVERCRNDASLLIITYTSDHNHADYIRNPIQEQTHNCERSDAGAPVNNGMLLAEVTVASPKLCGEENCDFFDELEELPVFASPLPSLAFMVQEQLL